MEIPLWLFVFIVIFIISFELRSWCECCFHVYEVGKENEMPECVKHMYS